MIYGKKGLETKSIVGIILLVVLVGLILSILSGPFQEKTEQLGEWACSSDLTSSGTSKCFDNSDCTSEGPEDSEAEYRKLGKGMGCDKEEYCCVKSFEDIPGMSQLKKKLSDSIPDEFIDDDQGISWPTNSFEVTSCYGPRSGVSGDDNTHDGIDVSAGIGSPVYAVKEGDVIQICNLEERDDCGRFGTTILIKHGANFFSRYNHLSEIKVSPGQQVDKGAKIASSGDSGSSEGPHLDFKFYTSKNTGNNQGVNPLCFYSDGFLKKLSSGAESCQQELSNNDFSRDQLTYTKSPSSSSNSCDAIA